MSAQSIVIAGYARSPFHPAHKGALVKVRAEDLAAQVIKGLVARTKVPVDDIEDLIVGNAFPEGEQGLNVARLIGFLADLPQKIGAVTVNRFCGSSMQAIHQAAGAIQLGAGEVFMCAGVESMSRVPMMGFNPMPHPELYKRMPQVFMGMGDTAENVASKYQITRKEQEDFAVTSHAKAARAQDTGSFRDEVVPITDPKGSVIDADGCIRSGTTAATLSDLKPAFVADGTVTAGTSSPLTDGASAVLVCTEDYAMKKGLTPIARLKSIAVSGCAPEIMGIGPVGATRKALDRASLTVKDLNVIELNEAFASQSLACIRDLGLNHDTINKDGGAIALGHPLGATGARIIGKAASLLKRDGGKYALATQCIGGGQGIATILETVS